VEKQIEEGEGDIIKLKRARIALLNISTGIPPEILGYTFAWNLVRKHDLFEGLQISLARFNLLFSRNPRECVYAHRR